jgi:hypothetical protein
MHTGVGRRVEDLGMYNSKLIVPGSRRVIYFLWTMVSLSRNAASFI